MLPSVALTRILRIYHMVRQLHHANHRMSLGRDAHWNSLKHLWHVLICQQNLRLTASALRFPGASDSLESCGASLRASGPKAVAWGRDQPFRCCGTQLEINKQTKHHQVMLGAARKSMSHPSTVTHQSMNQLFQQ